MYSTPLIETPELQALARLTGINPVKLAAACELLKPEPSRADKPQDRSAELMRRLTTV